MPKTIYHYHPKTGEYRWAGVAAPSPLEADAWLMPAYATPAPPPAPGAREVALYRDADGNVPADHATGDWQLLPDWRGWRCTPPLTARQWPLMCLGRPLQTSAHASIHAPIQGMCGATARGSSIPPRVARGYKRCAPAGWPQSTPAAMPL